MDNRTNEPMSGMQKAAVLLIAMGPEAATGVLQQLSPEEVRAVCAQIASMEHVDESVREQVLREYEESQKKTDLSGGVEYAKVLLEQALGPEKAQDLDVKSKPAADRRFHWIRAESMPKLAETLARERPQVIAFVTAHLPPDRAAELISQLPEELKGEVALRLSKIRPGADDVTKQIAGILRAKLVRERGPGPGGGGGPDVLANLINVSDRSTESTILSYLDDRSPELAAAVRQRMFSFEDIPGLEDRHIQRVIREVEQEDLRLSLKGAPDELKEVFFRNMSERAASALKEELEMMGPAKLKDVEAARKRIVAVVRQLREAGEISLGAADQEELVE